MLTEHTVKFQTPKQEFTRRQILVGGGAATLAALATRISLAETPADFVLNAAPTSSQLLPGEWPATPVWSYSGGTPGPVLRVKQGERLRVLLRNNLSQPTTVHWHGLRIINAMDGVPDVTQAPVQPGETFLYDFEAPDAGTYWYHPHVNSSEQVGRGLHGALIVEERDPPEVDRDVIWVLDDWRLNRDGAIRDDFEMGMDISHGGRMGNYITINGRAPEPLTVTKNERIRLRLINVANARIFGLRFEGHAVKTIAIDGHPVTPHAPRDDMVLLAPGQRADLVLDCIAEAGSQHRILDIAYQDEANILQEIVYGQAAPIHGEAPGPVPKLAPNPLSEPNLDIAERREVIISGGAMGSMQGAIYKGEYRSIDELVQERRIWALNGIAAHATNMPPLQTFARGQSYIITVKNETVFPHPMHLHGHAFRILSLDGLPVPHTPWSDTVLVSAKGTAELALVADNPGDWLFHCHVLSHVQGGMTSVFRVA